MDSAQSNWGLMQSTLLNALGDRQYNWAMDQYAKGEGVTDQTIANFLEMSGKGKGLADTILHQYTDQIKPLMDQWLRDAGSYASEGRQAFEAGKAMSTVGQADQAAMSAMEQKLGSFGVNVNSGRYQDMLLSARTQDAAARAGAGTAAAQHTEDVGRQMTAQGINWGQNMPGQAINAIQSSYAGLTGAENAILGLLNTGANLAQSAAPFFNAAVAANKLPPVANKQQSTSQGGSQQSSQSQQRDPEKGEGGQKQQQQPKEKGGGAGKGDGSGGGGSGPGMAVAPKGSAGSGVYKTDAEDEDPGAGTGGEEGYYGTIPYFDPSTGGLMPQWQPDTFDVGKEYGADTPQWNEPGVSNWNLPPEYSNNVGPGGFNVDPTANPYEGSKWNLDATWPDATPAQQNNESPLQSWQDQSNNYQQASYQQPGGGDGDTWSDIGQGSTTNDPWGGQDFADYENPSGVDDYQDNSYSDDYYSAQDQNDDSYYDQSDYEDNSYYDDYDSSGYDDSGYDASGDYEDNSYYDDYYDSGYDDYSGYDDSGGYSGDYGGESFSGDSADYYAQGGPVRRPPGMRPGGPPRRPQRPMPKPNGALSQRPMLRRPRPGAQQQGVVPTTGGPVPRSASPSQGRQTDDIAARLNAGEYVIPRDVVKHQGTKFFTDLIAKSRKLRTGMAGAKPGPTMRPALPNAGARPAFQSRPLPPR